MKYRYQVTYTDTATGETIAKAKANIEKYEDAKAVIEQYQEDEAANKIKIQAFQLAGYLPQARPQQ